MALVQINVKVASSIKKRIKNLVERKRYRDVEDFIVEAIQEKLEREGMDAHEEFKNQLIDLVRYDADTRSALEAVVLSTNIKFEK